MGVKLNYPDNYQTSAFVAGKKLAISRLMAIWTLIAFFIAICLCGILIWTTRSKNTDPFLIATNPDSGLWTVVGSTNTKNEKSIYYTMQEALIAHTIKDWFTIDPRATVNEKTWQKCELSFCSDENNFVFGSKKCAIYCSVSSAIFSEFQDNVLPKNIIKQNNSEIWTINEQNLDITRTSIIDEKGGNWLANGTIVSASGEEINVKIFITVKNDIVNFPQTMGFYITEFNAYRMNI